MSYILRFVFVFLLLFGRMLNGWAQDSVQEAIAIDSTSANNYVDQNNEGFKKLENKDHIQARAIPDSITKKLRNDDDFWYANLTPVKEKPAQPATGFQWVKSVVWVIIIGSFIAILILFLSASNIGLFRKRPSNIKQAEEQLPFSENIFEIDFNKAIAAAIAEQNFPLAVRYYYLQILKLLADKKMIEYNLQKTNSDYIAQLYKTDFYRDFFRLTRLFEYVWYGQLPLSNTRFAHIESDFKNFKYRIAA